MFYSGTQGELFIDGDKAGKVRSWSFNSSLGLLDATTLGDTDATSTPGIRTNTGSCQLYYYAPVDGVANANDCSTLINKLLKSKTAAPNTEPGVAAEAEEVTLKLAITEGGSSSGVKYIQGKAYLTSVAMTCAVGEVLSAQVAFQANGLGPRCRYERLYGRRRRFAD